MPNNDTVGKKIVEALKKQAENIDVADDNAFDENVPVNNTETDIFAQNESDDIFAESTTSTRTAGFFDEPEDNSNPFDAPEISVAPAHGEPEGFEIPANIAVLKKLISQLPSGVSRHTGAQIIKQTMEALGISMRSVLQDAQQVQENLKISARECQTNIQEYKKQIMALEKQSQNYQKQYSALNDLISLFIQTTK